jgi:hypothetical protein
MSAEEIRKLINLLENDNTHGIRLGPSKQGQKHHTQWESTGCESLAKDIDGEIIELTQPINVYAYVHHHAFDDGVPILKYFDRHARGYLGSKMENFTIPAGSKIVFDKTSWNFFGHDIDHGFFCVDARYLEDLNLIQDSWA